MMDRPSKAGAVLLSEAQIQDHIDQLAQKLAGTLTPDFQALVILEGGLFFAADLMRALYRRGLDLPLSTLRISSYGAGRKSTGDPKLTAAIAHDLTGSKILILDDVLESGHSLKMAVDLCRTKGAAQVLTCVFACKPFPKRQIEADFIGWNAPDEFLIGYGMDDGGRSRGQPFISAAK